MDHPVLVILGAVLARASPQVPVLVPVALEVTVHSRRQGVGSDVEFAVLI